MSGRLRCPPDIDGCSSPAPLPNNVIHITNCRWFSVRIGYSGLVSYWKCIWMPILRSPTSITHIRILRPSAAIHHSRCRCYPDTDLCDYDIVTKPPPIRTRERTINDDDVNVPCIIIICRWRQSLFFFFLRLLPPFVGRLLVFPAGDETSLHCCCTSTSTCTLYRFSAHQNLNE